MKICYSATPYRSHRRVAAGYAEVLRQRYDLVPEDRYTEADVVVLHHEPKAYDGIYARYPELVRKYVVGCCVWDANGLPESHRRAVSRLQEIWTCSRFSFAAFAPHHSRVFRIPYIVERPAPCTAEDLERVRTAIRYRDDAIYFLGIARLSDRRKNVPALVDAFVRQCACMPRARLIVKISAQEPEPTVQHPQLTWLRELLSDAEITALYQLAHVYVSAHHAEGWGLTLSDAMLLGTPVIATGYSGNLDFMTARNSYLLDYTEERIRAVDCFGPFDEDAGMRWAYPDEDDLARKLRLLYDSLGSEEVAARRRRATQDIECFSRRHVAPRLLARMAAIASDI